MLKSILVLMLFATICLAEEGKKDKQKCKGESCPAACPKGTMQNEAGGCDSCPINCEECETTQYCETCFPGFYIIRDKDMNGHCVERLPAGYIVDITNFYGMNKDIINKSEIYRGYAVAYLGKKFITDQPIMPVTFDANGNAWFRDRKVRLEAWPCQQFCRQCAEGFIRDIPNNLCVEGNECPWPLGITQVDGSNVCKDLQPDVFRAKVQQKQKAKKNKKSKEAESKRNWFKAQEKSLICMTNWDDKSGVKLTYKWNVYQIEQDGFKKNCDFLFEKQSNVERKFKIRAGDLRDGNYVVICEVSTGTQTVKAEFPVSIKVPQ